MGWLAPHQRIGVAVCSPHRKIRLPDGNWIADTVTIDWHRARTALSFGTNICTIELFEDGKEVGEARDSAARRCLAHNPRPEYIFFLDDDTIPSHDAFVKLFARAQWTPDTDIFAGVYCTKGGAFPEPLIYAGDGCGPFWDWAVGDLLTTEGHGITSVHMGLTLIRISLFQRMIDAGLVDAEADGDEPFFKTVKETDGRGRTRQGTEDIYFCQKALKAGAKILVDTSCLAGHIDKTQGVIWGLHPDCPPVKRAKWLGRKDSANGDGEPLKIALDLGAGGRRREWPGHRTYTLDIRPEAKPDYCQDTRLLNFPNDHWDLLASSHHLEHIGRWDQEAVWSEMFRVTKPGGAIEHIVPSLDWAARKISENEADEHTFNVLYGAQEAHGYERTLNLHYFGYTKRVAAALAEAAGFVDVTCEDWSDEPQNGYNLIIRGKKPLPVPEVESGAEAPACANGKAAELVGAS
jgi:hypothetical protein